MISKIILGHTQELIRDGIIFYLKQQLPETKFFESNSGSEIISFIINENPELAIISLNLLDISGVRVLENLKSKKSFTKIIVLSGESKKEYVSLAKEFGANGFFSYNVSLELLLETILRVVQSDLFICQEWFNLSSDQNTKLLKELMTNVFSLSKQEINVLRLFCNKLNTKEVAEELNVTTKSIDNYKNKIGNKLCLPTDVYFIDWIRKNEDFIRLLIS